MMTESHADEKRWVGALCRVLFCFFCGHSIWTIAEEKNRNQEVDQKLVPQCIVLTREKKKAYTGGLLHFIVLLCSDENKSSEPS